MWTWGVGRLGRGEREEGGDQRTWSLLSEGAGGRVGGELGAGGAQGWLLPGERLGQAPLVRLVDARGSRELTQEESQPPAGLSHQQALDSLWLCWAGHASKEPWGPRGVTLHLLRVTPH